MPLELEPITFGVGDRFAHQASAQLRAFVLAREAGLQVYPAYNPHLRQLLHVGFKIAAKMGSRYTDALVEFESVISKNVTANIFERHMKPLLLASD
jgi:hypothetical protein